jgi:hypothetical protein
VLEAMDPTVARRELGELMDAVSQRAQERGLTEDLLQEILAEADGAERAG